MLRLKTRSEFLAALSGAVIAKTVHFALHRKPMPVRLKTDFFSQPDVVPAFKQADVRMGAVVPKRWAKRAVTRNAVKRQIYTVGEDFARHYHCEVLVVRLRKSFERRVFISATSDLLKQSVREELQLLFRSGIEKQ